MKFYCLYQTARTQVNLIVILSLFAFGFQYCMNSNSWNFCRFLALKHHNESIGIGTDTSKIYRYRYPILNFSIGTDTDTDTQKSADTIGADTDTDSIGTSLVSFARLS